MSYHTFLTVFGALVLGLVACAPSSGPPADAASPPAEGADASGPESRLGEGLLFHASFDHGPDADFARGDDVLYTASSYDELDRATPGIGNPDVAIAAGAGRFGDALQFARKNLHAIFYRAPGNMAYTASEWSGTISFWLSLDPAVDLAPGYCDPIQLTDSAYNDAAIWVDFTNENPRQFRLGMFGDLSEWNPDEVPPSDNPFFMDRLIAVDDPPFESGQWTHVAITFSGINTASGGTANLYLNGSAQPKTMEGLNEAFTWDASRGEFRLGINYVGLFDELSIFDRSLSADEVGELYRLEAGVASLHP